MAAPRSGLYTSSLPPPDMVFERRSSTRDGDDQENNSLDSYPAPGHLSRASSSLTANIQPLRRTSTTRFLQRVLTTRNKSVSSPSAFDHRGRTGLTTLFTPSEPLIEYVFVHGLGGGSTSTWCLEPDPSFFWPREWLPYHPSCKNVRVHSFGYNSDWKEKGQSNVDVHDFGQALLLALQSNECFSENPIVFVCHSMGGILVKEAYIMARQDPSCHALAQRIAAMVFLATPHRGSDYATYLNNVLRVSVAHGSRAYISNIERCSATLTKINNAFRHFCDDVMLYSFFETEELSIGVAGSAIIVQKDSAVMGYAGERVSLLNANHRSVCKFTSVHDPNYVTVMGVLGSINRELGKKVSADSSRHHWSQIDRIETYLGMPETPEDDLKDLDDLRLPGSCDWFTDRPSFRNWAAVRGIGVGVGGSDMADGGPRVFWVHASPATGKSVLSSHVISVLEGRNADCSYYFFRHGVHGRSTAAACLRSLAMQMAAHNVAVRSRILQMVERGSRFERDNAKNIWRKILEPVLSMAAATVAAGESMTQQQQQVQQQQGSQASSSSSPSSSPSTSLPAPPPMQTQYWILDALDECADAELLINILARCEPGFPVKIFITSRRTEEIVKTFAQIEKLAAGSGSGLGSSDLIRVEAVGPADTRDAIRLYLDRNRDKLHVGNERQRRDLLNRILDKAEGSFLWVRLVLEELSAVWTLKQTEQVLDEVPAQMDRLYSRAVQTIASRPAHSVAIARAILTWTLCAIRPLTVAELQAALEMDLGTTVQDPEEAIPSLCAQLVHVDRSGRVLMVHLTAKTFLANRGLETALGICPIVGHRRIAELCLRFLGSDQMRPPRGCGGGIGGVNGGSSNGGGGGGGGNSSSGGGGGSTSLLLLHRRSRRASAQPHLHPFTAYASFNFAEHMRRTTSDNPILGPLLNEFLQRNILTWIEYVATTENLHALTRAADQFKNYLERQMKYFPVLGEQARLTDGWTVDLHRLVAKFGPTLLRRPGAIHNLIPPFCPTGSAIATVYRGQGQGHGHGHAGHGGHGRPARIEVVGLQGSEWDDHLACIDWQDTQAYAVASVEGRFAVGFTKTVVVCDSSTCQEVKRLDHGAMVRHLGFDRTGTVVLSGGRRDIKLWDLESESIRQTFATEFEILSFAFSDDNATLLVAAKNNVVLRYDLDLNSPVGFRAEPAAEILLESAFEDELQPGQYRRPPLFAVFSPHQTFLAVAYRGRPIVIYDLEAEELVGLVGRELGQGIDLETLEPGASTACTSLVFNQEDSIPLLAAAYEDGDLCLFDYEELRLVRMVEEADAQVVNCNHDGTLLATANAQGVVQLMEFETLQLLFRISAVDHGVRQITFCADHSPRFMDVRGTQCNVWEPALPSGRTRQDDASSNTEPAAVAARMGTTASAGAVGTGDGGDEVEITTLVAVATGPAAGFFFAGKSDGSVWLYGPSDGRPVRMLYRHGHQIAVTRAAWGDARGVLVTADSAGRFIVSELLFGEGEGGGSGAATTLGERRRELLDVRGDVHRNDAIRSVDLNPANTHLSVSRSQSDSVWDLATGQVVARRQISATAGNSAASPRTAVGWVNSPTDAAEHLLIDDGGVTVYGWDSPDPVRRMLIDATPIASSAAPTDGYIVKGAWPAFGGRKIIVDYASASGRGSRGDGNPTAAVLLLDARDMQGQQQQQQTLTLTPSTAFKLLCGGEGEILHVIGTWESRVVFLDKHLCVCSVDYGVACGGGGGGGGLSADCRRSSSAHGNGPGPDGLAGSSSSTLSSYGRRASAYGRRASNIILGSGRRASSTGSVVSAANGRPVGGGETALADGAATDGGAGSGIGMAYRYVQHFYIPSDWYAQRGRLRMAVTSKGDVLFARRDEVAVIKNGLTMEDGRREVRE